MKQLPRSEKAFRLCFLSLGVGICVVLRPRSAEHINVVSWGTAFAMSSGELSWSRIHGRCGPAVALLKHLHLKRKVVGWMAFRIWKVFRSGRIRTPPLLLRNGSVLAMPGTEHVIASSLWGLHCTASCERELPSGNSK